MRRAEADASDELLHKARIKPSGCATSPRRSARNASSAARRRSRTSSASTRTRSSPSSGCARSPSACREAALPLGRADRAPARAASADARRAAEVVEAADSAPDRAPGRERRSIRAGGASCWRRRDGALEVLLVHRPKYDDWSFPKGKCEAGESDEECALREVEEETSLSVRLGPELVVDELRLEGAAEARSLLARRGAAPGERRARRTRSTRSRGSRRTKLRRRLTTTATSTCCVLQSSASSD